MEFIVDELGYVPLLSELNSFPVDPDAATIENCRQRVEQQADILVLVVGGRYGSIDADTDKSITNLEYLAARSKGIPIYAYIEKKVLALVPVWEQNKNANFTGVLDDTRVLHFINQIRSIDKVWTHEFETAGNIIDALRSQLAYLMGDGLFWRLQLRQRPREARFLERLRDQALRIALERPKAWEYRLFGQILVDEVESCRDLKRDYEIGVVLGLGNYVSLANFYPWMLARIFELQRMTEALGKLVNEESQKAFGPPGTPGDPEAIIFAARRIGDVYRHALEWAQEVRRAAVENRLVAIVEQLAGFVGHIVEQIEKVGPSLLTKITEAPAQPAGAEATTVKLSFEIAIPNFEHFQQALEKLKHELNLV